MSLDEEKRATASQPGAEIMRDHLGISDPEKTLISQVPVPINHAAEPGSTLLPTESSVSHSASKKKLDENELMAHLPESERIILKRQIEVPDIKISYFGLYRYATRNDFLIIIVSALAAIIAGAALPFMTVLFGSLAGTFQGFFNGTVDRTAFTDKINELTLDFVYLFVVELVTVYIATVGFIYTGEHIAARTREQYLASILRQNIAYFDKLGSGEIVTRITNDTDLVQGAISEKVGLTLTAVATFVTAYVIGYVRYWKLTLILTSTIVAIFMTMAVLGKAMVASQKKSLAAYAEGGTVAEEVLSSIRNATAFGTQEKLAQQYSEHLKRAEKAGFRTKAIMGSMMGFLMLYIFLNYSLAFWLGSKYIVSGETTLSAVLTIMLSIMIVS